MTGRACRLSQPETLSPSLHSQKKEHIMTNVSEPDETGAADTDTSVDAESESPTVEAESVTPAVRRGSRKKKVAIAAIAAVVLAGVGVPTALWASNEQRVTQLTDEAKADFKAANDAHAAATASGPSASEALSELNDEISAIYLPTHLVVKPETALFSAEALEAFSAEITTYETFLTDNTVPPAADDAEGTATEQAPAVTEWITLPAETLPMTEAALIPQYLAGDESKAAASTALDAARAANDAVVSGNDALVASLTTIRDAYATSAAEVAASAPELLTAYLAKYPKAAADVKTALEPHVAAVASIADGTLVRVPAVDAVEAVEAKDGKPGVEAVAAVPAIDEHSVFKGYIGAVKAIKTSHDKAVKAEADAKRKADEKARQDAGDYDPGYGDGDYDPGYGDGDGGGGGGGGGGGDTGPGGGGGGDTGPSYGPRGSIVMSGSACQGSGGSSSANWSSSLMVPGNAANYWVTFESPGDSWGVEWICFAEDW